MTKRPTFTLRPLARFLAGGLLASQMLVMPAMASADSTDPKVAIRAVQNTLPSVAIIGQKAGPSDTTEVFIQVPGVLNMQSVYVLGDGKTVISGVVVPPVENGFPGGALTLPDGNASVNPRQPRANAGQLNQVLGIDGQPQAQAPQQGSVSSIPAPSSTRSADAGSGVSASTASTDSSVTAPRVAQEQQTSSASTAAAADDSGSAPASPSSASAGGPEVRGVVAKPSASGSEVEQDILIESLSDVAESGAFSKLVGYALENDADIDRVRNMGDDAAQSQAAYLDLVRKLPAIVQGEGSRKIYALFDPNCPFCHRYYKEVSLEIAAGQVQVHWIPAIVFPDNRSSLTASAALLAERQREGGDALGMLDSVMTDDSFNGQIDASPGVDKLVPYLDSVVKNTAVMAMARAETPLLVFERVDGSLGISPGIPKAGYTALIKSDS